MRQAEDKLMVASGEGWREWIVRELGVDMHTLLYLKWITNKDLLYGTEWNGMEFCLMLCGNLDGRRAGRRMDTCICMTEALCCPPETITTLLIGYIPK